MPDNCVSCSGRGARYYGSGSGWRGGMSTANIVQDVCDVCWGSGDESRPSENLRERDRRREEEIAARALAHWARAAGADFSTCWDGVLMIADVVEATTRKRKPRPPWADSMALSLARHLREAVDAAKAREAEAERGRRAQ